MSKLFPEPVETPKAWSLDDGIRLFLNRWSFTVIGNRKLIEHELRALIQDAKEHIA